MTTGFEVVAGQIRSAAGQMRSAAQGVKGADPSGDVGDVGAALPGSQSADAAGKLANAWEERFRSWHDDAVTQSDKLSDSAAAYDSSDLIADQRLRVLMHRTGETVS